MAAPPEKDRMIDVPVSMDALGLVLISKGLGNPHREGNPERRARKARFMD